NLANLHVLVGRFQVERDVAGEGIEDVEGVKVLEGLEERESGGYGGWGGSGGGGGWHVTQTSRHQHAPQCDLQPPLRLDHDVPLARDRLLESLGELHRLGDSGGIGELVVPLLQRVLVWSDALREDLIEQRRQRAVRSGQGGEVFHLKDEPPQLFRVGVLRGPGTGWRGDRRLKIARDVPSRV